MATSDTITGSRGGNSSGPWLELYWARQQVDIPNNRSLIRLTLRLHASATLKFSAGKTGNLHGSSFTYTGGFNGTGSKVLSTRDVWVNHNADGSKSQSFSASFNVAVSWSGSQLNSISVSGVANITAIPRASTLSAFSFASNLKPSTAVNLNYTIDRKSDSFRHQVQLYDGSHRIGYWDNVSSNGTSTLTLSTADVNSLLSRMSSVTSRSLTLRVATRSGVDGGYIGNAVTLNATATVDATVKPTVGALSVSQTGNSVSTHYLQGKSKIKANFTRTAVGGATISSSSITVRRKTTNTDLQTINSNDGTTGKTVSLTGTYEAQGMAKDSRGRTSYTAWKEFTVTAYSSPRITTFTADRVAATPTTVSISRAGAHSHLGGSNVLTYTVQRKIGTGAWTNVNTNATGTNATDSFSGTSTSTGNSIATSYDFRMVITDKFGESTESHITVSTQRVVLDVHKNEGVGIGKIHERGVLDVDGNVFINGINMPGSTGIAPEAIDFTVYIQEPKTGFFSFNNQSIGAPTNWGGGIRMIYRNTHTPYYMELASEDFDNHLYYRTTRNPSTSLFNDWVEIWHDGIVQSGSNSNGSWIKFPNGIMIAFYSTPTKKYSTNLSWGTVYYSSDYPQWTYPQSFASKPSVSANLIAESGDAFISSRGTASTTQSNRSVVTKPTSGDTTGYIDYMAMGRWK